MWQLLLNVITMKRMDGSEDTPASIKKKNTHTQNKIIFII